MSIPKAIRKKRSAAISTGWNACACTHSRSDFRRTLIMISRHNKKRALSCRMGRAAQWLILGLLPLIGCDQTQAPVADYASQRSQMVKEQIAARDVHDERVLAAMRKVPREQFVPELLRGMAYTDEPLPIGYEQTISQPYIVAFTPEQLHPQK